jgi:hypothetical protein
MRTSVAEHEMNSILLVMQDLHLLYRRDCPQLICSLLASRCSVCLELHQPSRVCLCLLLLNLPLILLQNFLGGMDEEWFRLINGGRCL